MDAVGARPRGWWRWSPFGLLLVAPLAAILTQILAPTPHGHWSSHLGNVAISAAQLVVLVGAFALLATRRPRGGRLLTVAAVALLAIVAVGLVVEMVGNQRVAASIWQTDYGDGQAGLVGPASPGFEAGHTLAGRGDWLVWLGGLVFTAMLGVLRRVPAGVAVAGFALALLPPGRFQALGCSLCWPTCSPVGRQRPVRADPPSPTSATRSRFILIRIDGRAPCYPAFPQAMPHRNGAGIG